MNKDVILRKAEFLRKPYGLASAVYEYFSGLHVEPSCGMIYADICIMLGAFSSMPTDPKRIFVFA
jgi:hypothetical protein